MIVLAGVQLICTVASVDSLRISHGFTEIKECGCVSSNPNRLVYEEFNMSGPHCI